VHNARHILEAIEAIEAGLDSDAIVDSFKSFAKSYGFETIYIAQFIDPAKVHDNRVVHITNWPDELLKLRAARADMLHDPIVRCGLRSNRPFKWSEARRYATHKGQKVYDTVTDFSMNDGLFFPIHGIGSISGGVSLGARHLEIGSQDILELAIVAQQAYCKLEDMLGPFPDPVKITLSKREVEVIQIAAAGKTNFEIAEILGVSEETVKAALSRAAKKLQASNRAHAVARAIFHNLILA
jgi:LuxR family transcriptional regulator, quorum-sensing system regulator BjaR1